MPKSPETPLTTFVADPDALLPLGVRVAGLGLGSVDYINDTIVLDDRAGALFDLPAHQPIFRRELHDRIHPDERPAVEARVAAMLSPGQPDFIDVVHRVVTRDGSERWLSARKQVSFDGGSNGMPRRPVKGLVAIMDMTAHKTTERQVNDLMQEMNHRLKNLLTVVQSIARMTARSGPIEEFLPRFNARMAALSHNQDLLVSRGAGGVALDALVKEQLEPFTGGTDCRVTIEGPALPLKFEAIQPIGLALHELATNATKHGALSTQGGCLEVTWRVTGGRLALSWTETGGPPVTAPARKGFGSTVLQGMIGGALEAEVDLDYRPEGLHWSVTCDIGRVCEAPAT